MEEILEFVLEFYMELMTHFVPEKKVKKIYLKIIAGIWAAILFIAGLIAIGMLAETNGESTAGKVILIAGFLITIIQIAAGLISVKRKNR